MTKILRSVLSLSALAVLSRATGYARTMVQAAVLGTGPVASAYVISSVLPNLLYELFLGGIIYSVFIPVLVKRISSHGEEDARRLTNALATIILPSLALVVLLGIVFAGPLVDLITNWNGAKNLSPAEAQRTVDITVLLFRIFAVQILFYGVGAIATGVLNSHRHFFLPNFTPTLFNLVTICSLSSYIFLHQDHFKLALYILAAAPTVGVIAMVFALLPLMYRFGYRPGIRFHHPALVPAAKLAGPMVAFVAASVGLQAVAYFLGTSFNAAPQLAYAFVVFSLPYGVFVVSIATALMPELSERHARGDDEGYRNTLSFGLRTMMFIIVPASIGMVALSKPIIGLLYERGNFGAQATETVAALLSAYAVGLLGYAAYFVLVRAFYSRQNTKVPALMNVGLFVLYAALAYGLSRFSGAFGGAVGVALALSGANAVGAIVALVMTRREIKRIDGGRLILSLSRILAAGTVMYAVAAGGMALLGPGSEALGRVLILVVVGGASVGAYLVVAFLLGAEELGYALDLLLRRKGKSAPQQTP